MLKILEKPKKMQRAEYSGTPVSFAVIDEPFCIETELTNTDFKGTVSKGTIEGNAGDVLVVAENGTMSIVSAKDFRSYKKVSKKNTEDDVNVTIAGKPKVKYDIIKKIKKFVPINKRKKK